MRYCLPLFALLTLLCGPLVPAIVRAQDAPAAGAAAADPATEEASQESPEAGAPPREAARQEYMGRQVAPFMTFHGAGWLIRDSRNREENTDRVMEILDLQPGMVVTDLGCGNGYYTLRMARQLGPRGRVLAVDIQPEMLQMLSARVARAHLDNVQPVHGAIDNPNLPVGQVDLLLMADVYHEFSHPESMLYRIRQSLKPTGVVALLEYREEDPTVPIKPEHKMSKAQIIKEYEANGFKLVRENNDLPWQHLMFLARDDSPLPKIEPEPWEPEAQ